MYITLQHIFHIVCKFYAATYFNINLRLFNDTDDVKDICQSYHRATKPKICIFEKPFYSQVITNP